MRDRLINHDFLVPLALFVPLGLLLMAGYEQLGLSKGAMSWLVLALVVPVVLLQQFLYERGRGRHER